MYPLFSIQLSLTNLGTIQKRHMLQLGMIGLGGLSLFLVLQIRLVFIVHKFQMFRFSCLLTCI